MYQLNFTTVHSYAGSPEGIYVPANSTFDALGHEVEISVLGVNR